MRGKLPIRFLMLGLLVLLLAQPAVTTVAQQGNTCEALVQQVISQLGSNCATPGNNQICFGFPNVGTTFDPAAGVTNFDRPGARAPLNGLQRVLTSGINRINNTFGMAQLNIQPHGSHPELTRGIVMILLGEVSVENTGGGATGYAPFQSFRFTTGRPSSECPDVTPPSILLQVPANTFVDMLINGARIRFNSTVILRTVGVNLMQVIALDGRVILDPDTPRALSLQPGTTIFAPLNARGHISGLWRDWRVLTQAELNALIIIVLIPGNLLYFVIILPVIIIPSGVGNPFPQIRIRGLIIIPIPPRPLWLNWPLLIFGPLGRTFPRFR